MLSYTTTGVLSRAGYSYFSLVGILLLSALRYLVIHFVNWKGCAQSPSSQHFICSDIAEAGRDPSEYNGKQGIHG